MQHILPAGFRVRRPVLDDLKSIVEMLQEIEKAEVGRIRTTESDLRTFWLMPGHSLELDHWLIIAPNGEMAAVVRLGHREPAHLSTGPMIRPAYTGLGLYEYLLELATERAHAFIPEAPADARVSLGAYTFEKNVEAHRALENAGFAHVRSDWLLQIDMDQPPPEPTWPEGLELRPYTPEMLYSIYQADNEAFQDHWGHTTFEFEIWQAWNNKRESFDPSLWFIVFDGDEIAGLAICAYEQSVAWVGELGVRRLWRHRGLGLALLYHAFGEFYRRGTRRVVLNADSQNLTGAIRLYTRAGMRPVEQYDIYQLELRAGVELSTQALKV
ncbi:MAG TPA: GNAT family N-acetyltransferase [Ktedonobacteraceae bacterium]|nr:GNAT family N-acetyltransferase [Ktedonobacteraceae bacterium]